ncbi:STAS domain-containing protein [Gracilibacillus kekensis]|uniref:RsbT co-antagonist protein RsbR n=1 Tax=Gracilibacillus kekensis TaxID=1027249 RepID=A0A1M7NSL8_9BACI|nr:STAS domain-containing protein [Gracilibacillus kekensis]SHN06908.1 rsbT co-antagonist protein RsbR [Gracilibacillus kekensis]
MSTKDKQNIEMISENILRQKDEIVHEIPIPDVQAINIKETLIKWRKALIDVYAESIVSHNDIPIESLENWSVQVSDKLLDLMLPLNIALEEISNYRDTISGIIKKEALNTDFSLEEYHETLINFNYIVDQAIKFVSKNYMRDYNDTISKARYAVDELSIPLVKITETVGIIPIIGEIDTNRADQLMKNGLKQGSEEDLECIVIDLSGVNAIDTMVAHQLFKVIESLELIGIQPVLSGIRPDIVQTMVSLGINMRHVRTFNSLHQALNRIGAF